MNEQELFRKVYGEILDYVEDDLLLKCANWGYGVHQTLLENKQYLMQVEKQGEQSAPFMYAVATAVIVGEFAKLAYRDHFSDETNLLLDELDLEFEQVSGFLNKYIGKDRFEMLEEINGVSLKDIWATIGEWKEEIYKSLVHIYKEQGEKESDHKIYTSLLTLFEEMDEETGDILPRLMDKTFGYPEMEVYEYISNGFKN
ncbi:hypothetical protein HQ403_02520 [Candidatus Kaiserbacteria bacterium]|nr:hypothetical protein [Candidatus Kaiserbacteria bacterium]